jgi:hypothetical protein
LIHLLCILGNKLLRGWLIWASNFRDMITRKSCCLDLGPPILIEPYWPRVLQTDSAWVDLFPIYSMTIEDLHGRGGALPCPRKVVESSMEAAPWSHYYYLFVLIFFLIFWTPFFFRYNWYFISIKLKKMMKI